MAIAFDANLGTNPGDYVITTGDAVASGGRIIVFLWWYGTETLVSCSGGGLTWAIDHQYKTTLLDDHSVGFISADAPAGLSSGTTITPTWSDVPSFTPALCAASWTGLATGASGYVDTTAAGNSNLNTNWATSNFVTTTPDCLLVSFAMNVDSRSNTATGGGTEIHDFFLSGSERGCSQYRIVSSASTYTLTGTWSGAISFLSMTAGVAYEAAAGGPPAEAPTLMVTRSATVVR